MTQLAPSKASTLLAAPAAPVAAPVVAVPEPTPAPQTQVVTPAAPVAVAPVAPAAPAYPADVEQLLEDVRRQERQKLNGTIQAKEAEIERLKATAPVVAAPAVPAVAVPALQPGQPLPPNFDLPALLQQTAIAASQQTMAQLQPTLDAQNQYIAEARARERKAGLQQYANNLIAAANGRIVRAVVDGVLQHPNCDEVMIQTAVVQAKNAYEATFASIAGVTGGGIPLPAGIVQTGVPAVAVQPVAVQPVAAVQPAVVYPQAVQGAVPIQTPTAPAAVGLGVPPAGAGGIAPVASDDEALSRDVRSLSREDYRDPKKRQELLKRASESYRQQVGGTNPLVSR